MDACFLEFYQACSFGMTVLVGFLLQAEWYECWIRHRQVGLPGVLGFAVEAAGLALWATSWYSSKSRNQYVLVLLGWFLGCYASNALVEGLSWGIIGCLCPGYGRGVWFSPLPGMWAGVIWLVCWLASKWGMVCGLPADARSVG